MKALIWKELRECLKWGVLPTLLILGTNGVLGPFKLMEHSSLFYVALIAAAFGAGLGFLQVFFESQGDRRSLLLHRPLSRSQIFLSKALAGVALYLVAIGIPFACAVGLAATPGHIAEPFGWPMALPWLADSFTGIVYYFAGMLVAQREARWFGSRCLGLAAGLCCSIIVWTVSDFYQALLVIVLLGGVVALAAWGSFTTGGTYASQPRLARIALVVTFLAGLWTLGFTGKVFLGYWLMAKTEHYSTIDHQGRALLVHEENTKILSVTDVEGNVPPELQGKRLGRYVLRDVEAPSAAGDLPRIRSYRNQNRFLVEYGNETKPGIEGWWYVPEQGRLLGYDKVSKRFIGSIGPDGFVGPEEQPRERFQGELQYYLSFMYLSLARNYLVFPGGVHAVDFRTLTVRTLFVPAAGETVLWASEWKDKKQSLTLAFVGTNSSVHVLDQAGSRLLSVPLAHDRPPYRARLAGRLEGPERYWVWYQPAWYLSVEALETMPAYVVIYDRTGREIAPRQEVPPRPGGARSIHPPTILVEPSSVIALAGGVTSPAEGALLVATMQSLDREVRENNGTEVPLLYRFLVFTTQFFIPGGRWDAQAHPGLVVGNVALMMLSAAICALVCFLLARRYAFSRGRCIGWTACGFLFGPTGLLLMLAVQEWPARIACRSCRKPRLVTCEHCEHCGAAHAAPALDGTEIFDHAPSSQPAVPAGC
jgi:hypothetical protein